MLGAFIVEGAGILMLLKFASDPMAFVTARFYYGMALEGAGEIEKAKAAYEEVVAHWGKARPKSVTAEKARARLKALGEKKQK